MGDVAFPWALPLAPDGKCLLLPLSGSASHPQEPLSTNSVHLGKEQVEENQSVPGLERWLWLRALAALTEDQGLVPSTHRVETPVPGAPRPSSGHIRFLHTCGTQANTQTNANLEK